MADDTRLADACLLLNYSSQSYREQELLTQNLQQPDNITEQNVTIEPNACNRLVDKNISSKLITPPPEQCEMATESVKNVAMQDNSSYVPVIGGNPNDGERTIDEPTIKPRSAKQYDECYQYDHTSREPIHNLLAAVNCAMPGLKSRPNILQRNPANFHVSNQQASQIPDHDYCQQVQPDMPLARRLSTFNRSDNYLTRAIKTENEINEGRKSDSQSKRKQRLDKSQEATDSMKKPLKLIAIHLGAGNSSNETESLHLAKMICEEVMLQTASQDVFPGFKRKRKSHENISRQCECCSLNLKEDILSAESAVVQLIKRMEDHQGLNCGYGSNLNMNGQVECDASLMSDRNHMWAGVGALSGCKNPILLAKSLYDHKDVPRPLGLVQPNLLVGSGAKQWMRQHCPHLSIMDSKMISQKSFSTYQKLKSRYDAAVRVLKQEEIPSEHISLPVSHDVSIRSENASTMISDNKFHTESTSLDHGFYCLTTRDNLKKAPASAKTVDRTRKCESLGAHLNDRCNEDATKSLISETMDSLCGDIEFQDQDYKLDTVGAVAVDCDNNFASAISSGGLLLKYKGRVGQAAVPGAGCWSEDSIAVTTTGVGEYLTLNMFARKFYDKMLTLRLLHDLGHIEKKPDLSDLISCGMEECFEDLLKSPALAEVPTRERLAGMLAVSTLNSKSSPERTDDRDLYLSYAHNTNSMCIGYMTCNDSVGHSVMSRKVGEKDGDALVTTLKFSLDQSSATNKL